MMSGARPCRSSPEECQEVGGVCISEALITRRNLSFPEDEQLSERIFHTLADLQTVRLDREGITTISNLEGLQNLHSLYLQANKIQRIENLACVPSLRFLSLAGNRIRQVENLLGLPCLQFLDLSENQIETLKLEEFPQSLLILNLTGNKCTTQDGYRELVTKALPLLLDLDGQPVSERWNSDEEQASGDEDEEFPELSGPFCSDQAPWLLPGFLKELEQQLSRLREHRQQAALADHLLRMEMKPTLTSLPPQPPGVPMAGDSSPSPMPRQGKETAPEAPTSSLASSPTKKSCPLIPRHQPSSQARKDSHVTTAPKISNPTKTVTKRVKK
ncbi:leucine-rich repeat-containing protein 46 isoform X1 [Ochotona princeps]|uniref:leucine-rich repeat-containing protein 46 isoform X1 n=1 Tax=Ochotona princeps TaxID=9978 RepID=UPI00271480A9|nr:leucine-rich repeat-containing protein 46 isoform X1 [Ochotona princeps]